MNILFANYGDFTTNSTLHIAGFANRLAEAGHDVIVAAPDWLHTLDAIPDRRFQAGTYRQVLDGDCHFANYQPAAILHGWTPRQPVLHFARQYLRRHAATRLLVHLEDNEEHLLEVFCERPFDALAVASDSELEPILPGWMIHPRHYQFLLAASDGVSVIHPALAEFVPPFIPVRRLFPPLRLAFFQVASESRPHPAARQVPADTRLIVYPGGLHPANVADFAELAHAVESLNRAGIATLLLRTGPDSFNLLPSLPESVRRFIRDLGVVRREEIPLLLASADALVQPGGDDAANHYRFPSKLPEFLAAGRPLLAPVCHRVEGMVDGKHWLALQQGDRVEISERLSELWTNPEMVTKLGESARAFAESRFSACRNTSDLDAFYHEVLRDPPNVLRRHWLQIERGNVAAFQRFSRQLLERRSILCRNRTEPGPWPTPDVRDRALLEFAALEAGEGSGQTLEDQATRTLEVKAYPEIDREFRENAALAHRIATGRWVRMAFTFEWSDAVEMRRVRFDPGDAPGLIRIAECRVSADGRTCFHGNSRRGFPGVRVSGTAVETTRERSLDLFSIGNDPNLIAVLPSPVKNVRRLQLVVRLFVLPLPDSYHGTETLRSLQKRLVQQDLEKKRRRLAFWQR